MAGSLANPVIVPASVIPLLDASSLPSAEDWALLESINAASVASDFEPDFDRFGRFRLSASFDE